MNEVTLIGRVGNTPELKKAGNNNVCKFSLATDDTFKNSKGEKVKTTTWHNLVAWNKTAENCAKFIKKGSHVVIRGKITNSTYVDKEGIKRFNTDILVEKMILLDKKEA